MSWMSASFKNDKRYLELQLKRGQIKQAEIEKILSALPDVEQKAMTMGKAMDADDENNTGENE